MFFGKMQRSQYLRNILKRDVFETTDAFAMEIVSSFASNWSSGLSEEARASSGVPYHAIAA
jgi:hypothetical protein